MSESPWKNKLYFGDNLDILREHIPDESVDLIYLDPPFNSKASYNVLFAEKNGTASVAQIHAFEDTWSWNLDSDAVYQEIVAGGPRKLADLMHAMRQFLGQNDMMAYLVMMAIRLIELRRVMKPKGSIYLHCDPTASHYIKLLMDAVFGHDRFINEIVWKRSSAHSDAGACGRAHDIIFLYAKNRKSFTWNKLYQQYDQEYMQSHYRYVDERGRKYRTDNLTATGLSGGGYEYEWNRVKRIWRCPIETMQALDREGRIHYTKNGTAEYIRYLDEMPGVPLQDLWNDIPPINSQAKERLNYPTQKPEALLERIIRASSNEGDLVLDPFCGCGTTVAVAERLQRRWIGIDVTWLAIDLMERRLEDTFETDLTSYEIIGEPKDLRSAEDLARRDRFQFEWWVVTTVGAQPAKDKKKGSDSGVDGYIYFFDTSSTSTPRKIVVQVKSGKVSISQIRDLKGVVEREKADIGVFLTLEEPTKPMITEAVSSSFVEIGSAKYPKIQILTIREILEEGKGIAYPDVQGRGDFTYKRARRQRKSKERQITFDA